LLIILTGLLSLWSCQKDEKSFKKPNILIAIADDQSYPHSSIYGFSEIQTPAFDFVAKSGSLFHNAFVAAPGCSPSRAALLTGKNIWELEEAGTHASNFPSKFKVFTEDFEENGYHVGFTGKGWGPGNWQISGRTQNPAGKSYNNHFLTDTPTTGISKKDYVENFKEFLHEKESDQPFVFWFGAHEPHRIYEYGTGKRAGKEIEKVSVPAFLPNTEIVKNDILDYILEIEYFDQNLLQMIELLRENGELNNTIIIVTADNGMPFPYAKANVQEFGTHVPLAISVPGGIKENVNHDPVSLIDLAPTLLDLCGLKKRKDMSGKSLRSLLTQKNPPLHRNYVLTGRERHTHARPENLGYPARAIRTQDFLYVYHFFPNRWPAGDPVPVTPTNDQNNIREGFQSLYPGFHDVDDSPSKEAVMAYQDSIYFELALAKRPREQLYDIKKDPYCINNIIEQPSYKQIANELKNELMAALKEQRDPRVFENPIFDSYPRYSNMRNFSGFNKRGEYNKAFIKQTQLEKNESSGM